MKLNVKYLNRLFLAVIVTFLIGMTLVSCQSIQGIYSNAEDFNKNVLFREKINEKKCRLCLSATKPYVKVKYTDSTFIFQKDSIFGYRDLDGNNFRFYEREVYPILNQGEQILLYKREKNEGSPKSPDIRVTYFFSRDASSPILPLTERNLTYSFKENKTFLEFLEIHFSGDNELLEYDNIHKMYKINRLLQLSNKSKND